MAKSKGSRASKNRNPERKKYTSPATFEEKNTVTRTKVGSWTYYDFSVDRERRIEVAKARLEKTPSKNYLKTLIKEVANNNLQLKDAILIADARRIGDKSYKENVRGLDYKEWVKEQYQIGGIKDKKFVTDKDYYENVIKKEKNKRDKYIESGLYEEMRYLLYVENYKKALNTNPDNNPELVNEIYNILIHTNRNSRYKLMNELPSINSFYHGEGIEEVYNDYNENIIDVLRRYE